MIMTAVNSLNSMRKVVLAFCIIITSISFGNSQSIIINEVNQAGQWVELYNASTTTTTNVSTWILCDFPRYDDISDLTIISGNMNMPPDSYLVISWPQNAQGGINANDGEVGLYVQTSNFGSPAFIRDYMQYGSGNQVRASVAVDAGVWNNPTAFVANAVTSGNSLEMSDQTATGPSDTGSSDWSEDSPTQGATNFPASCPSLLTINDDPISPDTYEAEIIESAGHVEDNGVQEVSFFAETEVRLLIDFSVDNGGIFVAQIQDCSD